MSFADVSHGSFRLDQAESSRLTWAFCVSVALHLLVGSTYYTGKRLDWWQNFHLPAWLEPAAKVVQLLKPKDLIPVPPEPAEAEPPLMFVEVSPAQATAVPPKDAKYYSSLSSQAANPEASKVSNVPKIDGDQTQIVRTQDVPFRSEETPPAPPPPPPDPAPLAPDPPAPEPVASAPPTPPPSAPEPLRPIFQPTEMANTPPPPEPTPSLEGPAPAVKPAPIDPPGDKALAMIRPQDTAPPREQPSPPPRPRPTRLSQVPSPDQKLAGKKMALDGGVLRLAMTSLDAKATPYGAYDAALIYAVQRSWYRLLDDRGYASDDRGKVVLEFVLHPDGRVSNIRITENSTSDLLGIICQRAIEEPEPFDPWPSDMHRMLGDTRRIQFTFFYN
jgi:outer membrane biosynthesis protein TonB